MAMYITQDTFDEVVKENMEDFGMDRTSAAEDAVGQFKAQGAERVRVPGPIETAVNADGYRVCLPVWCFDGHLWPPSMVVVRLFVLVRCAYFVVSGR